jgi:hypothetical protein
MMRPTVESAKAFANVQVNGDVREGENERPVVSAGSALAGRTTKPIREPGQGSGER